MAEHSDMEHLATIRSSWQDTLDTEVNPDDRSDVLWLCELAERALSTRDNWFSFLSKCSLASSPRLAEAMQEHMAEEARMGNDRRDVRETREEA